MSSDLCICGIFVLDFNISIKLIKTTDQSNNIKLNLRLKQVPHPAIPY